MSCFTKRGRSIHCIAISLYIHHCGGISCTLLEGVEVCFIAFLVSMKASNTLHAC